MLRRERDSNPRYPFGHTRVPVVHLQPLGHLSAGAATASGSGEGGIRTPGTQSAQQISNLPPSTTRSPLLNDAAARGRTASAARQPHPP